MFRALTRFPVRPSRVSRPLRYYSTSSPQDPNSSISQWKQQIDGLSDRLRLWGKLNASLLRQRATTLSSSASTTLHDVGGKLNKVTGYDEIETLKRRVVQTEERIAALREASKDAKIAYAEAVANRASCQREVNDLLQRKSSWTDNDVVRFTALVRQDHLNEQTENSAKSTLETRESDVESEFNELMRAILNRYHEEQVWSDKIRSASTYGSLLALGANIMVFILAIVIVEPYKRKRLAQTFEKRIEEISRDNKAMINETMTNLTQHFERQEVILAQVAEAALKSNAPTTPNPSPLPAPTETEPLEDPPVSRSRLTASELEAAKLVGSAVGGGALAWIWFSLSGR